MAGFAVREIVEIRHPRWTGDGASPQGQEAVHKACDLKF
jgi:hypothetical protein